MGEETNKDVIDPKVNKADEVPEEYKKLMKKQHEQEAQIAFLIAQQQTIEDQAMIQQMQQQERWVDQTRCLVSKQCMCDLYYVLFIGNEREGIYVINNLISSISQYQGEEMEGRMMIDKNLITQLKYAHDNKDVEGMYVIANEICFSLSVNQRREIVNILVSNIMQNGGLEDEQLISALKESVGNPGFFKTM